MMVVRLLLAEVRAAHLRVVGELRGRAAQHDGARLDDVAPLGDGQRHGGVLLHEQDRRALPVDVAHGVEDLLDEHGRQPHARLVEQEQARARHERAADRQHLLLAARERAGDLGDALVEPGEQREDALEIARDHRRVAARVGAHHEVLAHAQAIEDAAALGHVCDAALDHHVRRHARERLIVQRERAPRRHEQSRDRAERRRLPRAVVAEQRHDLALADLEPHALERGDLAVGDVDVVKAQHWPLRAARDTPR